MLWWVYWFRVLLRSLLSPIWCHHPNMPMYFLSFYENLFVWQIFTVYLHSYLHINTFVFFCDIHNRLHIQSRSLDVVYNPAAVKWLADFFTRPHQAPDAQLRRAARHRYEAVKQKTKQEFMRNWEQILEGKLASSLAVWHDPDVRCNAFMNRIFLFLPGDFKTF